MGHLVKNLKDNELDSPDIIHGQAARGELFTLVGCWPASLQAPMHRQDPPYVTYRSPTVIRGYHLVSDQPMMFSSVMMTMSGLTEWLARSYFQPIYDAVKDGREVGLGYAFDNPVREEWKSAVREITVDYGWSVQNDHPRLIMDVGASLTLRPAAPFDLSSLLGDLWGTVRDFFTFALGTAPTLTFLAVSPEPDSVIRPKQNFLRARAVILTEALGDVSQPSEYLLPLLDYADIKQNFGDVLGTWLDKSSQLGPIYDLYAGAAAAPNMYVNLRFLSFIQALETYHRRVHPGPYLDVAEYDRIQHTIKKAIPSGLPRDLKESIERRLEHANELSLRSRLRGVLQTQQDVLCLDSRQVAHYVGRLVEIRNYLTHYSEIAGRAPDPTELRSLTSLLRMLVELSLMRELGLSPMLLKKAIERQTSFQLWAHELGRRTRTATTS